MRVKILKVIFRFLNWLAGDSRDTMEFITGKSKAVYLRGESFIVPFLISLFLSAASSVIQSLMAEDVKFENSSGYMVNSESLDVPVPVVYGKARVGGNRVWWTTTGSDNNYFHAVYTLSEGEVQGIETDADGDMIWLDDKRLTEYQALLNRVAIQWSIPYENKSGVFQVGEGLTITIPGSVLNSTATVVSDSGSALTVSNLSSFTLFTGEFWSQGTITGNLSGATASIPTGTTQATETDWDVSVTDDMVTYEFHSGSSTQTVSAAIQAIYPDWDDAMRHTAYLYVRYKYDMDLFQGVPELTVLLKGRKLYDPRSGLTTYTTNPALVWRDWMLNKRYAGPGIDSSLIDDTTVTDAANWCDSNGYTFNGAVYERKDFMDNLNSLLVNFRGKTRWSQGKYELLIMDYDTPVMSLDEDDVIGDINIHLPGIADTPNVCRFQYPDPDNNYVMTEKKVQDTNAVLTLDGEEKELEMEFMGSADVTQATKLATYYLERARLNRAYSFNAHPRTVVLEPGDMIQITYADFGWTNQVVRVTSAGVQQDGTVSLSVLEETSNLYNDTIDVSPHTYFTTTLPNPLAAPSEASALSLIENLKALQGVVLSMIQVAWKASTSPYVHHYEVWYKKGSDDYIKHGDTDSLYTEIVGVTNGTYTVKVVAVSSLGTPSTGITANITVAADVTIPVPSSLTLTATPPKALLAKWAWSWSTYYDSDVAAAVQYRIYAEAPPTKKDYNSIFSDLPMYGDANGLTSAYANALYDMGITSSVGYTSKLTFSPDNPITREQASKFMIAAWNGVTTVLPPAQTGDTAYFDDLVDTNMTQYINLMKEKGITTGCGERLYCPTRNLTRKEAAIFIVRLRNVKLGNTADAGLSTAGYSAYFSDVTSEHTGYYPHINTLFELAFGTAAWKATVCLTGSAQGSYTFSPDRTITRKELAVWVILALGQSGSVAAYDAYFSDIANDDYDPYINKLKELGGTTGTGTRYLFDPGGNIQQQHYAQMISQALGVAYGSIPVTVPTDPVPRDLAMKWLIDALGEAQSSAATTAYFSDLTGADYPGYVNKGFEIGLTVGTSSGTYSPDTNLTRAQAAAFVVRAVYKSQWLTSVKEKSYTITLPDYARYISVRVWAELATVNVRSVPVQASYVITAPTASTVEVSQG